MIDWIWGGLVTLSSALGGALIGAWASYKFMKYQAIEDAFKNNRCRLYEMCGEIFFDIEILPFNDIFSSDAQENFVMDSAGYSKVVPTVRTIISSFEKQLHEFEFQRIFIKNDPLIDAAVKAVIRYLKSVIQDGAKYIYENGNLETEINWEAENGPVISVFQKNYKGLGDAVVKLKAAITSSLEAKIKRK